jgi:hypothetical protein
MFKAVTSVLCYPDGVTAINLVEGRTYEFSPPYAAFMLERGLIEKDEPKRETKPAPVAREVKKKRTPKRTKKVEEPKNDDLTIDALLEE